MNLRIDPWDPEYGASVELEEQDGEPAGLDLQVEVAGAWAPIAPAQPAAMPRCAFVDGVRRIDARLFAETGAGEAPAAAGAWAVGCAWSGGPPRIDDVRVGRELVVGGGLAPESLTVSIGGRPVCFDGRSVPGAAPLDPSIGIQNAMRKAEGVLAARTLASGGAGLVVTDGPLTYFESGPAVGMVKRQSRSYLDPERGAVLGALRAGERTPIFKLGEQRLERFTWYLRLAERRTIDAVMAGIVRLEVAAHDGLDSARELAGVAGAVLPRFAPRPGRDPRAPQNLHPIGALESLLRHRLGDATLLRRAIEVRIHAGARRGA